MQPWFVEFARRVDGEPISLACEDCETVAVGAEERDEDWLVTFSPAG